MLLQLRDGSPGLNILTFAHTRSGTTILKCAFKTFSFHQ